MGSIELESKDAWSSPSSRWVSDDDEELGDAEPPNAYDAKEEEVNAFLDAGAKVKSNKDMEKQGEDRRPRRQVLCPKNMQYLLAGLFFICAWMFLSQQHIDTSTWTPPIWPYTKTNTTTVPTLAPTSLTMTSAPTKAPTGQDLTNNSTDAPTDAPTEAPTVAFTGAPTEAPTVAPTVTPTQQDLTNDTTDAPTEAPTVLQ